MYQDSKMFWVPCKHYIPVAWMELAPLTYIYIPNTTEAVFSLQQNTLQSYSSVQGTLGFQKSLSLLTIP